MNGPEHPRPVPPDPSGGPPSIPWHPIGRVGFYLALFLAIQVVVGVPALFIWSILIGVNPVAMMQGDGVAAYTLFVYACMAPVLIPLTVAFLRRIDGKSLADLGVRWPAGGARSAVGESAAMVLGPAALLALWLGAAAALGDVALGGLSEGFRTGVAGPGWWPRGVAGGSLLLALQGGVEEWVFRGYVFRTLRERYSWASAAGGSSLIFAVFHSLNQSVDAAALANTFLLGLILAGLLELTGSLIAPSVFHGAWNFLMAGLLSLPVSGVEIFHLLDLSVAGPVWLTGGDYGPEASWVLAGLLLPVVVAVALRIDRRAQSETDPAAS